MSNIENRYNYSSVMARALILAKQAALLNEVPVASIIIDSKTKNIIASAYNMVESQNNSILHSEIVAISETCRILGTKYLDNCEIYITLQPCIMCYTAISYARISKIYFGAFDNKNGFKDMPKSLYKPEIYGGIMQEESERMLSDFFKKLR